MQIKPENARRRVALQFAGLRIFIRGMMLVMAIFLPSMIALTTTNGAHGRTTMLIALSLFYIVLLASVIGYIAVRLKPRIARKEIVDFIELKKSVMSIYEEGIATTIAKQASFDRQDYDLIANTWNETLEDERRKALTSIHQSILKIGEIVDSMSREDKLRNQGALIDLYADIRNCEALELEVESMSLPEISREMVEEIMRATLITSRRAQEALQKHIDWLTENLNATQMSLEEAQQLL